MERDLCECKSQQKSIDCLIFPLGLKFKNILRSIFEIMMFFRGIPRVNSHYREQLVSCFAIKYRNDLCHAFTLHQLDMIYISSPTHRIQILLTPTTHLIRILLTPTTHRILIQFRSYPPRPFFLEQPLCINTWCIVMTILMYLSARSEAVCL